MTEEKTTLTDESVVLTDEQKETLKKAAIEKFVSDKEVQLDRFDAKIKKLALPIIQEATYINDKGEAFLNDERFVVLIQNILSKTFNACRIQIQIDRIELD
jgi:hypothetical protein